MNAPNIMKMPYRLVKSSDHEKVRWVRHEFDKMWEAQKREFDEIFLCWRFFFSAAGETWDEEAIKYKTGIGLRVGQYNLIAPKVNILHGAIMMDTYDHVYDPVNRKKTQAVEDLETAYYTDKEVCDYYGNYSQAIRDGLIHLGVLEPVVSDRFSAEGNIWFRRAIPGRWVFDPYYKADDDYYCMKGAKHGHYTADMLERDFPNLPASEKLEEEKKRLKKLGMDWTVGKIDEYNTNTPLFDHAAQVIEFHWLEEVKTQRILAFNNMGEPVVFPVTEDRDELQKFAMENGVVDWSDARSMPYRDRVDHQITICDKWFPDKLLEDGKPEVQIGRLPALQFTAERDISGRNKGIVRDLIDPQQDVNYAKSKVQEFLASALGGGMVYNKQMLPDDADQQDFEKNHNDPTRSWGLEGDPNNFMAKLRDANINPALMNQIGEAVEFMDRISRVTAAMQAETEGSNEPASLYAMKLRQSKSGNKGVDDRVKGLRRQMAEAYLYQAPISYSGVPRTFTTRDGRKSATFNEEVYEKGRLVVRNNIEHIPRCSVTIREAPGNMSRQIRIKAESEALLESLPETYREHIAIIVGELTNAASVSEDVRAEFEVASQIEKIKARVANLVELETMKTNGMQAKSMGMQAKQQIEQLVANFMQQKQPANQQQTPGQQDQPQTQWQQTAPVGQQ